MPHRSLSKAVTGIDTGAESVDIGMTREDTNETKSNSELMDT